MPKYLKIILLPFSWLYGCIIFCRNKAFDYSILKSTQPNVYTICVGNIAVGGTGKSPMVAYLAQSLSITYSVAILSRGYGRHSQGFRQVAAHDTAGTVGDEPLQYYLNFEKEIPVFVGENRVEAYKKIIKQLPSLQVLILDDAYQHRYIKAHENIVLCDYNALPFTDSLLPAGRLREPMKQLVRAQKLIVTKCPEKLSDSEIAQLKFAFKPYLNANCEVHFSKIVYDSLRQFSGEKSNTQGSALLVSGIANPKSFETYCKKNYKVVKSLNYPDHHNFSKIDIENIENEANGADLIICTEKDYVKLRHRFSEKTKAFYQAISIVFIELNSPFLSNFNKAISQYYNNKLKNS